MSDPVYYLGIDTGGTFTDGVLLDPITHDVVKTVKVLTTPSNLHECISSVLDALITDDAITIGMVSISTTLITNAIAEGKRKPVALLLLGYDQDLVTKFNFISQFGTPHYFFIKGRHDLYGNEQEPLDEAALKTIVRKIEPLVDAFAVVSYGGPRNNSHEGRAGELISGLSDLPVVLSHHLSNELDSIRRATTASLNASLLSYGQAFIDSVHRMLERKGIDCPVMLVRGDGSVVRTEFAKKRPVEIIHSGPATSAIGGQFLAGVGTGLVVDMGGTTTDIALVEKGKVEIFENSATVGPYRTAVKTIKARSFGLGGDSLIRLEPSNEISIGPQKVMPISHLASLYPTIKKELYEWIDKVKIIRYFDRYEYWVLRQAPARPFKSSRVQKALELLKEGPQPLRKILKQVGAVSPVQLHMDELVNQDLIERAALTPTDLLHVTGEYAPWDADVALRVVQAISKNWSDSPSDFINRVCEAITHKIVLEVIQFVSDRTLSSATHKLQENGLDRWLYDENFSGNNPHLGCNIYLKIPIIGIGAPAEAFIPQVAKGLGTSVIFPKHYAVANAVGTVVGNVMVRQFAEIIPIVHGTTVHGFQSSIGSRHELYDQFEDALVGARDYLKKWVVDEAVEAGTSNPEVIFEEKEVIPGMLTHLNAWAIGKPGL